MNLSKAAYIMQDFPTAEDAAGFDFSIFNNDFELNFAGFATSRAEAALIGFYAGEFLDNSQINDSCIAGGFDGLSFGCSGIFGNEDDIDITVSYYVKIPVKLFVLDGMKISQRVRLRKWTGFKLTPAYSTNEGTDDQTVYITESGTVYHTNKNCSHIKLSVRAVMGIPDDLRNASGGKFYPCELCCSNEPDDNDTYYITSYGDRFHTVRNCSGIKRNVKEIKLSEVENRTLCKRCASVQN